MLRSRALVARKRVFMTATPRVFDGDGHVSMSDPVVFGPVAHSVSFGQAIDAGLLCDYQVLVVAAHAGADLKADPGRLVPAALTDAVDAHRLSRVLSFHSRVAKAADFARAIDGAATPSGRSMAARHISGAMPTVRRRSTLAWLEEAQPAGGGELRVVSNARCLTEGVDVPAVDGLLFADRRTSVVGILQAVGRVLRPAPGKRRGTIILPVVLPADGDDDSALATSAFEHVWAVLRGLREHDQRLAAEVDSLVRARIGSKRQKGRRCDVERVRFVLPDDVDVAEVRLRLIQEIGSMWERNYALLEEWAQVHAGALLPRGAKSLSGRICLGEWAEQQRIAYRRGHLTEDRARRLERVPGWSWDKTVTRWWDTYRHLAAYADAGGTVAENPDGVVSRFEGMKSATRPARALGVWMAEQRQAYRLGTLPQAMVEALERLPGWAWDAGLPAADVEMVEALRLYVEFEKHARVPDDHVEDGLRLGAWCWAVRRRRYTGRLAPALYDEIMAATPSKFRSSERFQWEVVETKWRIGYFALRQFSDREGQARPTGAHREELPDTMVGLGQWVALQRMQHRRGELSDEHARLLEALPGWQWEVPRQRVQASEPVDLPAGTRHASASAFQNHGCRCQGCLEWSRARSREWLARQRQLEDPVSAVKVRRHLQELEDGGAKRTVIAEISGVPLGVVRKIAAGQTDQIEREHRRRLLAVTPPMCSRAENRSGSRGRTVTAANEQIPSGPTFDRLTDLRSRGFGPAWVARELGYARKLQLSRNGTIIRRNADAIADLYERVGDLRMPPLGRSVPKPRLAQLLAARERAGAA